MSVRSYKDLLVWQKSMDMVLLCYDATKDFPKNEMYGLTRQIRRSAVSVPANIAEGKARGGEKEFQQFLRIASGSLAELETMLELSHRLALLHPDRAKSLTLVTEEVGRMLHGLQKASPKR